MVKKLGKVLATADLGSNSFRLQICRMDGDRLLVLDSIKEMVRLGAGLDENKMLTNAAQERALACLAQFAERLRGFPVDQVRIVATNTFRVAKNIDQFIEKAKAVLGFPVEVIAGREEARLIYLGVAHTLPVTEEKRLVIDIGGGSTEFVIGHKLDAQVTESLPLGCVSYSIRYFDLEHITQQSFNNAILGAKNEIQRISRKLKKQGWDVAIGTSGSARSIRDMFAEGEAEDVLITLPLMKKLAQKIIDAKSIKKADLKWLKSDREEVFIGGLVIMIAIFEELKIKEMQVIDVALREGVLYDLIGRSLSSDMRDRTVAHFEEQYFVDVEQAKRVAQTIKKISHTLEAQGDTVLKSDNYKYLMWAAKLHEIGMTIAHTAYHKHSAYIVANADMPGFSRFDQKRIARLILSHRGDLKKMNEQVHSERVWLAILIFRLAALFCRGRKEIKLPKDLQLIHTPEKVILEIDEAWLQENPLTGNALLQEQVQWASLKRPFVVKGILHEG